MDFSALSRYHADTALGQLSLITRGQCSPLKMPILEVKPTSSELLQHVANSLAKARKVVIITGAGISTNSGIPVRFPLSLHLKTCTAIDQLNRISAPKTGSTPLSKHSLSEQKLATLKMAKGRLLNSSQVDALRRGEGYPARADV